MAAPAVDGADGAAAEPGKKNHNKYRKEKPWDHDGIEHWKIDVRVCAPWPCQATNQELY